MKDMTRQEFKSLLPKSIEVPGYGTCKLQITSDNKLIKAACYYYSKKVKFGFRQANSFEVLYGLMVDWLEREVL